MNKLLVTARWLLILVIVASALLAVSAAVMLWQKAQIDAFVADPAAFETVPDNPRAHFAKATQLVRDQEPDLALEQLTLVLGSHEPELMPEAYFNRGNINLREALTMTASDGRQIPLIELAKQDYRSALALDPIMWDARYNLEIALRVVPEDPELNPDFEKNIISSQRSIESKGFKVDLP
jgi:mxaK protein